MRCALHMRLDCRNGTSAEFAFMQLLGSIGCKDHRLLPKEGTYAWQGPVHQDGYTSLEIGHSRKSD